MSTLVTSLNMSKEQLWELDGKGVEGELSSGTTMASVELPR
jgi:hypothetical protein